MDITTLAAANAYTDKKVGAGGGGGVKIIDLRNEPYSALSTKLKYYVDRGSVGVTRTTFSELGMDVSLAADLVNEVASNSEKRIVFGSDSGVVEVPVSVTSYPKDNAHWFISFETQFAFGYDFDFIVSVYRNGNVCVLKRSYS